MTGRMNRTYRYGARKPTNWGADVYAVSKRQVDFWNRLVGIEDGFLHRYRAALRAVDHTLADEEEAVTALRRASERDRSLNRTELRHRAQALAARRRAARDKAKPDLVLMEEDRRLEVKRARQESGLWWPHYQTVLAEFDAARRAGFKRGGSVHRRQFGEQAKFSVLFPKGLPVRDFLNGRSQMAIMSGHRLAGGTDATDGRHRKRHHAALQLAIDRLVGQDGVKSYRYLQVPLLLDRPLPPTAIIKAITLQRHEIGSSQEWSAQFLLEMERGARDVGRARACGVDMGWRMTPKGLRVACWAGSDGQRGEVLLPQSWLDKANYLDQLRRKIAEDSQRTAREIVALCGEGGEGASQTMRAALLGFESRATRILTRLAAGYSGAEAGSPAVALLQRWWIDNWREVNEAAHLGKHLADARAGIYQEAGLYLARRYDTVAVEAMNLGRIADLRQKTSAGAVRRAMRWAALSVFQHWLRHQADKHGARHLVLPTMNTTQRCSQCGHLNRLDTRETIVRCKGCRAEWDQDDNAATNLMNEALAQ